MFSGFTFDDIVENLDHQEKKNILDIIDYFVDGKFVAEPKDVRLPFRGSSNQKIWKNNWNGSFEIVNDEYFKIN